MITRCCACRMPPCGLLVCGPVPDVPQAPHLGDGPSRVLLSGSARRRLGQVRLAQVVHDVLRQGPDDRGGDAVRLAKGASGVERRVALAQLDLVAAAPANVHRRDQQHGPLCARVHHDQALACRSTSRARQHVACRGGQHSSPNPAKAPHRAAAPESSPASAPIVWRPALPSEFLQPSSTVEEKASRGMSAIGARQDASSTRTSDVCSAVLACSSLGRAARSCRRERTPRSSRATATLEPPQPPCTTAHAALCSGASGCVWGRLGALPHSRFASVCATRGSSRRCWPTLATTTCSP